HTRSKRDWSSDVCSSDLGGTVRVLVVDDQSMIRAGFAALLDAQEGIAVVGTADDGLGITDVVRRTQPDVVLMDIRMPKVNGLDRSEERRVGSECGGEW